MSRTLDAALVTSSTSQYFNFRNFAKLEFDSGTIYVNDGVGSLSFGGNEYLGVGDFGTVGRIEEGGQVSPYSVELTLSGLDATFLDEALNQDYALRPVTLYVGSVTDGVLDADPDEVWSGIMDVMEVSSGVTNAIRLVCESDMARFDAVNGKRFSNTQLQLDYSGDLGFEYLDQMIEAKVIWRGREVSVDTGAGSRTFVGDGDNRESQFT